MFALFERRRNIQQQLDTNFRHIVVNTLLHYTLSSN